LYKDTNQIFGSFYTQVCLDWKELAATLRDEVFEHQEEHLIDIHDVKVTINYIHTFSMFSFVINLKIGTL
jgi:hypothetical protein